jgi:O-antigen/teichoic acid export membrane protein
MAYGGAWRQDGVVDRRKTDVSVRRFRTIPASLGASPVLRGAAFLYGSTVTTSLLGFVFWLVAARLLEPAAVGGASAVQSAAQLVATAGILGLGTLSVAELSIDKRQVRRLVSASCLVAGAASAFVALFAGIVVGQTSGRLAPVLNGGTELVVFVLLAATTAAGLVIDDASIGLLRGDIQLIRNTVFAAIKLLLLPLAVYAWSVATGEQIVVAWLIATVGSLALAGWLIGRLPADSSWRPDFANLVAKRGLIWNHHLLNVAVLVPRLVPTLVVATMVGPAANAGFYTATFITGFVNIIPGQLSLALFAIAPGDEGALSRETRSSLRLCAALAVVSAVVFGFGSHALLGIFRHSYESAAPAMVLLGLGTLPYAVKAHYVAIARVRGHMRQAAFVATVAAAIEIAGVIVGASLDGVTGTAAGLLAAWVMEAIVFAPTVISVLRASDGGDQ